MSCSPICDGSEYRCLDCGQVWEFCEEPPQDCRTERSEQTSTGRILTDAEKYRIASGGE